MITLYKKLLVLSSIVLVLVSPIATYANDLLSNSVSAFYTSTDNLSAGYQYLEANELTIQKYSDETNAATRTFYIDPTKHAQQYLGVGSSLEEASVYNFMQTKIDRQILLKRLFGQGKQDFNLNLIRVTFGSSDFTPKALPNKFDKNGTAYFHTYDDNNGIEDPSLKNFDLYNVGMGFDNLEENKIKLLQEAMQINSNLLLFGSAWTAPAWMKEKDLNNKIKITTNDGQQSDIYGPNNMIGGKLSSAHISDLANYYLKILQKYAEKNITFYSMSEFNEPCVGRDTPVPYPNICITSADAKILASDMKKIFKANHINTRIWLNDYNFGNGWEIINTFLTDPNAKNDFDGIAYHAYYGNVYDMKLAYDRYQSYRDHNNPDDFKGVYMTELMTGWLWQSNPPDNRIYDAARLLEFFHQRSSSYINWVTLNDQNMGQPSGEHTDYIHSDSWFPPNLVQTNDSINYSFDFMAYVLGSFSKQIERNAYALEDSNEINNYYDNHVEKTPYRPTDIHSNDRGMTVTDYQLPVVSQVTFENPDHSLVTIVVNTDNQANNIRLVFGHEKYQISTKIPPHSIETIKWMPVSSS